MNREPIRLECALRLLDLLEYMRFHKGWHVTKALERVFPYGRRNLVRYLWALERGGYIYSGVDIEQRGQPLHWRIQRGQIEKHTHR